MAVWVGSKGRKEGGRATMASRGGCMGGYLLSSFLLLSIR